MIGALRLLARNVAAVRRVHVRLARARRRRVVVVLRFDLRLSDVLTTANRKAFNATIHRITTQHNNVLLVCSSGRVCAVEVVVRRNASRCVRRCGLWSRDVTLCCSRVDHGLVQPTTQELNHQMTS